MGGDRVPEAEKTKLVSSAVIAQLFGVTTRRVQQLTEEGIIPAQKAGKANRYDIFQAVRQYVQHLSDRANERDTRNDKLENQKLEAEIDLKQSKAAMASLQLRELEGKMHRSEDVEAMTTDMVYAIRGMLIALPGRLAVDVVELKTAAEAAERIRLEVFKILEELANYKYDPEAYRRRLIDREGMGELITNEPDE